MKKVLITGANSYIGTSVEKYITEHYPEECTFETLDMRDSAWRKKSFSAYDVIFHVAGIAHQKETKENADSYYRINCDLAVGVAIKAKEDGVKQFIFLSSMSVYGLVTGRITKETQPKPKTNYGKSKFDAEEKINALSDESFKVCTLRPPMVYGDGCKGNYQALCKIALKLPAFPYIRNERSMIFIDNLSEFVRLIIKNEEIGLFFPQNSEYVNTSHMVKNIAIMHGKNIKLIRGFGWIIKILFPVLPKLRKAFGNLTYDKEMSRYKEKYAESGISI